MAGDGDSGAAGVAEPETPAAETEVRPGRLRRLVEKLRGLDPRVIWAGLFIVFALFVLIAEVEAARVWPVAVLLVAALLLLVVKPQTWHELLSRVETANFGPVSFGLRQAAREAAAASVDDDDEKEQAGGRETSMFELRTRLEFKLAYVAKHLLVGEGESPTYLNVGSLVFDKYLTDEEGKTALGILETRQEELDALPDGERKEFLANADTFVGSVRANIFWGQVKRCLRDADSSKSKSKRVSLLRGRFPSSGRRDDFRAGRAGGPTFRVATAFALDEDSSVLDSVRRRVKRDGAAAIEGERAVIVVPGRSRVPVTFGDDDAVPPASPADPHVIRITQLRAFLAKSRQ